LKSQKVQIESNHKNDEVVSLPSQDANVYPSDSQIYMQHLGEFGKYTLARFRRLALTYHKASNLLRELVSLLRIVEGATSIAQCSIYVIIVGTRPRVICD